MAATALAEHLRQHEAGWTGAEHEDRAAHLGRDLIKAMGGAGGGFEEGGVDVGEIFDVEDSAGYGSIPQESMALCLEAGEMGIFNIPG